MVTHFNETLKQHVTAEDGWAFSQLIGLLHEWATRFVTEFEISIPTPAISVDRLGRRAIARYKYGHNGFGLRYEITFNTRYLQRSVAKTLETLLHEQLHCWQELHGKPGKRNYHNKEFREQASFYGLLIDEWGHLLGVELGLFTRLLAQFGVDTNSLPLPHFQPIKVKGQSKMKKWSCGCCNIRAAVKIRALCLVCGHNFQQFDSD